MVVLEVLSEPINHKYNTFVHVWLKKYNGVIACHASYDRTH